ncbi:MAG TPA: MmcQ/YjbR family DNA-binding protein [Thermoanaerobaculia bacterium]|nr:MmcQ/YjbR family DNA-binding protein [Thermoanaerobaculia bacterium]
MTRSHKERLFEYCRRLPGVTEDVKWEKDLVFSVGEKMFAVFMIPEGEPVGFKVDEEFFPMLIQHPGIVPAPYMAKHSWVSVTRLDVLPAEELERLLARSHHLVANKLSKKKRRDLGVE